jgi:hypothetical protein
MRDAQLVQMQVGALARAVSEPQVRRGLPPMVRILLAHGARRMKASKVPGVLLEYLRAASGLIHWSDAFASAAALLQTRGLWSTTWRARLNAALKLPVDAPWLGTPALARVLRVHDLPVEAEDVVAVLDRPWCLEVKADGVPGMNWGKTLDSVLLDCGSREPGDLRDWLRSTGHSTSAGLEHRPSLRDAPEWLRPTLARIRCSLRCQCLYPHLPLSARILIATSLLGAWPRHWPHEHDARFSGARGV